MAVLSTSSVSVVMAVMRVASAEIIVVTVVTNTGNSLKESGNCLEQSATPVLLEKMRQLLENDPLEAKIKKETKRSTTTK